MRQCWATERLLSECEAGENRKATPASHLYWSPIHEETRLPKQSQFHTSTGHSNKVGLERGQR